MVTIIDYVTLIDNFIRKIEKMCGLLNREDDFYIQENDGTFIVSAGPAKNAVNIWSYSLMRKKELSK